MIIKMEDRKGKIEVIRKKIALKGGVMRIEDDWTDGTR